jgi:hypothetical protein
MQPAIEAFLFFLQSPALIPALLAIGAAGLVRGFAGFGAAMLFMPVATYLYDPRLVVVAFFLIDWLVTLPLAVNAFKKWELRTVLPAVAGAWAGAWFGAYLLATTDALVLRWAICGIIIALVLLLLSGWRYHGAPKAPISFFVGGGAGILGGVSQVSAPPVVAYWASGPANAPTIRANLITFFFFSSIGSFAAFLAHGVFTAQTIALAIWLAPAYGLGLYVGARFFHGSNDKIFRRVALVIIIVAAITSLPLLDPILRA